MTYDAQINQPFTKSNAFPPNHRQGVVGRLCCFADVLGRMSQRKIGMEPIQPPRRTVRRNAGRDRTDGHLSATPIDQSDARIDCIDRRRNRAIDPVHARHPDRSRNASGGVESVRIGGQSIGSAGLRDARIATRAANQGNFVHARLRSRVGERVRSRRDSNRIEPPADVPPADGESSKRVQLKPPTGSGGTSQHTREFVRDQRFA